jgi:hypothetical protein
MDSKSVKVSARIKTTFSSRTVSCTMGALDLELIISLAQVQHEIATS